MVAGASDNDPTTVGALTVVGTETGYRLSWLAVLVFPMLAVVQEIAAQVGAATGADLQTLTKRRYGGRVAFTLLVSVLVVNVMTIAADLEAGAAAIGLLTGLDWQGFVVPFSVALVALLAVGSYAQVVTVLRWVLVGFVAYAVAAILAHPGWSEVLRGTVVPGLSLDKAYVVGALSLVGTTLTSYVYIWEGISQAEERPSAGELRRVRRDARAGAALTVASFWAILVASGATLGTHHLHPATAQDAAQALRPLAGSWAADLFAFGLLASALVALPVLLATTAHVLGSHFDWRRGLSEPIGPAWKFYAAVVAAITIGAAFAFSGVFTLGILVIASIAGSFGTPFSVAILVLVARDQTLMCDQRITRRLALGGWVVTALVGGLGVLFLTAGTLGRL